MMNDVEKFQEQLERAADLVRRFPSFLESFGELAEQMGYVDKRTGLPPAVQRKRRS